MFERFLFSVLFLNFSSNVSCMHTILRKFKPKEPLSSRLVRVPCLQKLIAKRSLIYSVREWQDVGSKDGGLETVDIETRIKPWIAKSALFAKYKKQHVYPSFKNRPQIPTAQQLDYIYVARLRYSYAWCSLDYSPRYLFFQNNDDLDSIIRSATYEREVLCGGEIEIDFSSGLHYHKHIEYKRNAEGKRERTGKNTVTNETLAIKKKYPKLIEFYATKINQKYS